MQLLLPLDLSIDVWINPLIKIILQSKPLFTKVLYSAAVPNTAFESQTVPQPYSQMKMISYLRLNVGRQAARTSGRADGTHSRWQVILPARLQECKKARTQEWRKAWKPAIRQSRLRDGWNDGRNECKNAIPPDMMPEWKHCCRMARKQAISNSHRQSWWLSCKKDSTKSGLHGCKPENRKL